MNSPDQLCTLEKRGNVYILTLLGPGQHRLNPDLINSIRSLLRPLLTLPSSSPPSALITTSQGKFFSNGYDLAWAKSDLCSLRLMSSSLRSLIHDIISLPMPTICAITGHASAAGIILALSHDYLFMNSSRGFLYMSEMDIGMVLAKWFVAVLKGKLGGGRLMREVVMKARKLTAKEAVEMGVVEEGCDGVERTVERAVEFGEELVKRRWDGEVVRENRVGVWGEIVDGLMREDESVEAAAHRMQAQAQSKAQSKL